MAIKAAAATTASVISVAAAAATTGIVATVAATVVVPAIQERVMPIIGHGGSTRSGGARTDRHRHRRHARRRHPAPMRPGRGLLRPGHRRVGGDRREPSSAPGTTATAEPAPCVRSRHVPSQAEAQEPTPTESTTTTTRRHRPRPRPRPRRPRPRTGAVPRRAGRRRRYPVIEAAPVTTAGTAPSGAACRPRRPVWRALTSRGGHGRHGQLIGTRPAGARTVGHTLVAT